MKSSGFYDKLQPIFDCSIYLFLLLMFFDLIGKTNLKPKTTSWKRKKIHDFFSYFFFKYFIDAICFNLI